MNNHFKLGKPLNVIWHFKRPDGENYSLAGLQHELVCYNSRGRFKIKDSVINVEDTGALSFTLTEEMQTVEGAYSFHLSLLRHGTTVNTIVKNDAIILSKHIIDTDSIQEDEPTTIEIFSVGEFELFRPTAPVAGSDGWWYFDGQPILDDEGNKVSINVTIDIDDDPESETFGIITLDKGRDGGRETVITGMRNTFLKVREQGDITEAQGIEAERQGNEAERQGNVTEAQGNEAERQGNYAVEKGDEAVQIATEKGDQAISTANAASTYARQQGDNAVQIANTAAENQNSEITDFKEAIRDQVNNYKPIVINGNATNAPDEEDITSNDENLLQFKNRSALNGMGYIIMRKNKTFAEQLTQTDTIYEIRYDFDLDGQEITIPEGCVLDFQGGSLNNGSIVFDNTKVIGNIAFINVRFYGACPNTVYYADEWGADNTGTRSSVTVFNDLISLNTNGIFKQKTINLGTGTYVIDAPIVLLTTYTDTINFCGCGFRTLIKQISKNTYVFKVYEQHNISDLQISYSEMPTEDDTKSVAFGINRAIFSNFKNIEVRRCYNVFSFLPQEDRDGESGAAIENAGFVNCVFDTIRVLGYRGYVFDTRKPKGGDSGSLVTNLYIGLNDENITPIGCMYFNASEFIFNQLNIEIPDSQTSYIQMSPGCHVEINYLHCEGPILNKYLFELRNLNTLNIGILLFGSVDFNYNSVFFLHGQSTVNVTSIYVAKSCTKMAEYAYLVYVNDEKSKFNYNHLIEQVEVFDNISKSLKGLITNNGILVGDSNVVIRDREGIESHSLFLADNRDLSIYKRKDRLVKQHFHRALDNDNTFIETIGSTTYRPNLAGLPVLDSYFFFDTTLSKPIFWNGYYWVDGSGIYADLSTKGESSERPIINSQMPIGFQYFDTTLNKPIWNNGTNWVDATPKGISSQRPTGVNDGFEYYDTDLDMPIYWDTRTQRWLGADGFTAGYHKGDDESRPTLTMYDQGYTYWDVFLNKLIVWNGSAWVDSNGTEL